MRVWIAVWVGSTIICRTLAALLRTSPALKLGGIAGGVLFLNGLHLLGELAAAGAVVWLLAAVVLGLRAPAPALPHAPAAEPPPDDEDDEDEAPPPAPARAPGIDRAQLHAALRAVAAPHAHIASVATHLGVPTDRVRDALAEAGIPVSGAVRERGRVSTGVRAADIPHPDTDHVPAPDGVVAAGQASNNNNDNAGADGGYVVEDDPTNSRRAIVRWTAREEVNGR